MYQFLTLEVEQANVQQQPDAEQRRGNITQYINVYNSVEVEPPVANAVEIELHEINEQAGNIKYVLMYIC